MTIAVASPVAILENRGMDSPHAWVTIAIGQYLLLVWSATFVAALLLGMLSAVWARYFPRRVDLAAPGPDATASLTG